MAESATHLTSAIFTTKPSIFEVLAQDSLMNTIRPALKHAIKVLAETKPDKFAWMLRFYDEIYTILDLILQNYYLHSHSGSFAENFYGIKRIACQKDQKQEDTKLPRSCLLKSILCLVILPYIKHKLDFMFEELRHKINTGRLSQNTLLCKLYKAFVAVYPYVHMVWEGSFLVYLISYMFGKSKWHSPFVRLSGVELVHQQEEDLQSTHIQSSEVWQGLSLNNKLLFACKTAVNLTAVTLSTGLSVGVFFLQFLDWWYTSDNNAPSLLAMPTPDPPKSDVDETLPPYDICPVCLKRRTNDTALSVSGFVFCYPCIYEHIQQYSSCPVTSYPARKEHLIKLYPPGA